MHSPSSVATPRSAGRRPRGSRHVGEVVAPLIVVAPSARPAPPGDGRVERIDRDVDLVDRPLVLVGVTVFNDADHRALVAHAPARSRSDHRRPAVSSVAGRALASMRVEDRPCERTRRGEAACRRGERARCPDDPIAPRQTHRAASPVPELRLLDDTDGPGRQRSAATSSAPWPTTTTVSSASSGSAVVEYPRRGGSGRRRGGAPSAGPTSSWCPSLRRARSRRDAHGASTGYGWGDRTRTRTGWTKTTCAASYTTPQERDGRAVYPRATPASPPCGGLPCARLRPMAGS